MLLNLSAAHGGFAGTARTDYGFVNLGRYEREDDAGYVISVIAQPAVFEIVVKQVKQIALIQVRRHGDRRHYLLADVLVEFTRYRARPSGFAAQGYR